MENSETCFNRVNAKQLRFRGAQMGANKTGNRTWTLPWSSLPDDTGFVRVKELWPAAEACHCEGPGQPLAKCSSGCIGDPRICQNHRMATLTCMERSWPKSMTHGVCAMEGWAERQLSQVLWSPKDYEWAKVKRLDMNLQSCSLVLLKCDFFYG